MMFGCMGFLLQRDYACNVETGEVQVCLCVCHPICVYVDHSFCHSCLLGIWRPAFDKCKCPSLAAQKRCPWSCCCSHANSSGNLKWFSANLTVDGYQGLKKRKSSFSVMRILTRKMPVIGLFVCLVSTLKKHASLCSLLHACDSACLVLCYSIPILWTQQLNSWSHACYFHSVHHSLCCSHECFPHCQARHGR